MPSALPLTTARHIAIIRRNGLGDLLCSMPLVAYCRQSAPNAKISLIVSPRNAPLLPFLRGFDNYTVSPSGNKYLSALMTATRYWYPRLDVAIGTKTTPSRLTNWSLWFLRARYRVGVVNDTSSTKLVNHGTPLSQLPEGTLHQSLAILKLVAPHLNQIPEALYPRLHVDASSSMRDKVTFGDCSLPTLFVSMTNNRPASSLGIDGHAHILNELVLTQGFRVIISCEPKDLNKGAALQGQLKCPSQVIPTESLQDLLHLLQASDSVFVGDGGIMHLAAALDKPQTVLFNRDILTQWRPLSAKATCLVAQGHVKDLPKEVVLSALKDTLRLCLRGYVEQRISPPE